MGIYDRDWYRDEQKSPYEVNNSKISREAAERIKKWWKADEPPKVDPKYRFEFTDNPTENSKQPSDEYDPTYGCGYGTSTSNYKTKASKSIGKRGLSISIPSFLLAVFIASILRNVLAISNILNEEFLNKNSLIISIEVGSRLGLVQTLGILGTAFTNNDPASIWRDERVLREVNNVLYDWYAPIKWPPVLSVSKEIGLLLIKARVGVNNAAKRENNIRLPSPTVYAYVKSDALNVRSGPSANNRVVATISKNTRVEVLSKTGVWWKIKYENVEGYVNSEYLLEEA